MVKIDSVSFGEIVIDGKKYGDVLIVSGVVFQRDVGLLKKDFGTCHKISEEELKLLLREKPDFLVIGKGHNCGLEVKSDLAEKILPTNLIATDTKNAVIEFNRLYKEKKRVNALLHSTC